jgi:hypothetical protein
MAGCATGKREWRESGLRDHIPGQASPGSPAAAPQSPKEGAPSDSAAIHGSDAPEALRHTKGPEPHAPGVVKVAGEHLDSPARSSREWGSPKVTRESLKEERGGSVCGLPSRDNGVLECVIGTGHRPLRGVGKWLRRSLRTWCPAHEL